MIDQESPQQRQKEEFEVLKSMYPNELVDLRKISAKNKWKPLNLSLTLLPSQGNDPTKVYAKVNLHISCSNKYPEVAPKIELDQNGGLTKEELNILQNELENLAHSKIGEVMIFNLAEHVESFLDSHRKPLSKSCYDEMVTRQKRKEEEERQALEREMDRERKVLQKEIQEREEMSKIESSQDTSSNDEDTYKFKRNSSVELCCCDKEASKTVEFSTVPRVVQKGKCLRHVSSSLVLFTSMDYQTGEILLMYEWKIQKKDDFLTLAKLISAAEQEFTFLVKLEHSNLVHYLNIKCDYSDHNYIKIYLLREFAYGLNCQELYLNNKISVGADMLRYIATDVLSALDYLHQNNVVHKEIGASSIYLTKTNVKLANFSLYRRFTDITSSNHQTNYNKRTDIYRFGLFLLSLLKGEEIDEVVHIPESISADLYDFLKQCVGENEKGRFTTQQLLEHPFIKLPIEKICLESELHFSPNHQSTLTLEQQLAELQSFKSNAILQSRVQTEFEVLHTIGKGAFGEVFKVRNKLDQRFYAIKRMVLNPKKKQGNKKIIQEVKTLSRLNHEHVVRYFNSWIETTIVENDDGSLFTSTDTSRATPFEKKLVIREKTDSYLEKLNNYNHKEWSISFKPKSSNRKSSSSSESVSFFESDSSDDSASDSIEFERDENEINSENKSEENIQTIDTIDAVNRKPTREIQYMYIQMEFCEKSTLRTAIDAGLCSDKDRVWRLFREIVDGLIYIHQQGMIHRDLKPVNIFLNKNDHVKIGDFGLATPSLLPKANELASINSSGTEYGVDKVDKSMTGHIGTVLYVAPEIDAEKPSYNQRVDTYSLGIIFFEMSYKPINTGMERIFILTKLRTKEIEFPSDYLKFGSTSAETIIKLLLNHNGNERPSSLELKEKYIPSPTEKYNVILEHVRNALANPNSKIYKDFMSLCLQQNITHAQDILYDRDPSIWNMFKHRKLYDFARKSIIKTFKLHGGQNIPTPLLLPKSKFYEHVDSCVTLMTKNGTIVSIPHDLRVPFARYLAWNEISILRRYSIERVYREKKELDRIPRELYECAFDIVTPSRGNFVLDAELFSIFKEIVDNLLGMNTKKCTIRLNHPLLVKAILLQCNIKDRHSEIFNILSFSDLKDCQGKARLQIHLTSLGISDTSITMLFKLLETEVSADNIDSHFQMLTRKKSTEIGLNSKKALSELKSIIQNIESFGVDYNIIIVPNLLFKIQQYSGVMFQIGCQPRKKHSKGMDILAAGGRYDSMITDYRCILKKANLTNLEIEQTAVGISISLDKMAQILIKHQAELDEIDDTNQFYGKCDQIVSVLCLGSINNKEKTRLMSDLWTNGIKSSMLEGINEELADDLKVPILIIFKDTEQGVVSIRYREKDRVQNKRIKRTDVIDFIQQLKNTCYQQRFDHNRTISERNDQNNDVSVNILFVTSEKISGGARRKYENQILTQLHSFTERFNGEIIVLVLTLDLNIIRTLSSYLNFENDYQFNSSVKTIIERHQQNRKYLNEVCDEIKKVKFKKTQPIIILYSLQESVYKIIF